SGFGGYATVSMKDLNSALDQYAAPGTAATHTTSGFYVGADAGITVLPFLKIGPRLEYLQPSQASVTTIFGTANINSKLLMYELGVTADTSLPLTGLSVLGGIWGGYGVANATLGTGGSNAVQDGTGTSFVGEVAAQLRYKMFMGLSLGVDLGYLMANVATVNGADGKPMITNQSGGAVGFDFSGLHAGGALSWDF
ncbi:MAG TPA: hypothetical protein VNZ54_05325, partial [bacterium]|nr:hypothetical protein [bacterium]